MDWTYDGVKYGSSLTSLQQNISVLMTSLSSIRNLEFWKDSACTMGVLVLDRGLFWLWVCAWVGRRLLKIKRSSWIKLKNLKIIAYIIY